MENPLGAEKEWGQSRNQSNSLWDMETYKFYSIIKSGNQDFTHQELQALYWRESPWKQPNNGLLKPITHKRYFFEKITTYHIAIWSISQPF